MLITKIVDKIRIAFRYTLGFPRSVVMNLLFLPFKQAIQLPILVSHKTRFRHYSGKITIKGKLKVGLVKIGFGTTQVVDFRNERTIIDLRGIMHIHGKCKFGAGSKITVTETGVLILGNNFNITSSSSIICNKEITFGDDCLVSWNCIFMDTDQHRIFNSNNERINQDKGIIIGDKVWFGCNNTVLKGAKVASNTVVGACSRIDRKFRTEGVIISGNPAQEVKQKIYWK